MLLISLSRSVPASSLCVCGMRAVRSQCLLNLKFFFNSWDLCVERHCHNHEQKRTFWRQRYHNSPFMLAYMLLTSQWFKTFLADVMLQICCSRSSFMISWTREWHFELFSVVAPVSSRSNWEKSIFYKILYFTKGKVEIFFSSTEN